MSTKDAVKNKEDFEKGRSEGFRKLRAYLGRINASKSANRAMTDTLGIYSGMQSNAVMIRDVLLMPVVRQYKETCLIAIDALENGSSVYDITQTTHIPGYKHVVGGDYNAGIVSAARDLEFMLFSMDSEKAISEFIDNAPGGRKLYEQISGYESSNADKMSLAIALTFNEPREHMIACIERHILAKTKTPKSLLLASGETEHPKKYSLKKILKATVDVSNFYMRLDAKVPSLWSPKSINIVKFDSADAENQIVFEEGDVNNAPDFTKGYKDTLIKVHGAFQENHFDKMWNGQYVFDTGLALHFNKVVARTAEHGFSDFRAALCDKINADAKGNGKTYDDGVNAASAWLDYTIKTLTLSGSMKNDPNNMAVLNKLKPVWLDMIVESTKKPEGLIASNPQV